MSDDASAYIECVSTRWSVGVYRPVGVERAMLMSAWGRMVIVGLVLGGREDDVGVMEDRKSGHSTIALERVFRRMGR